MGYYLQLFGLRFHVVWPVLLAVLSLAMAGLASCHAIMYKRDTRATIAWVGVIWLAPFMGTMLYVLLGINRIRRKAAVLRGQPAPVGKLAQPRRSEVSSGHLVPASERLGALVRMMDGVTGQPLLPGNRIVPLVDGDQAYPAMLEAIDRASQSLALSTYIFDNDQVGRTFIAALKRARARGVEVRVLIDGIGANYSWPTAVGRLRREHVPVARFMRKFVPAWFAYANLRNHRKILIADGRLGFTGGINIRDGHCLNAKPRSPIRDVHFRVEGPVVAHLAAAFVEDWAFSTGEALSGERWFPPLEPCGPALARGVPVGPDEDFEKLRMALHGGLACAQSCVRIVTPYFLPDAPLITALNVAAMRGVEVDILLPQKNNLRMVGWASTALLWQVLVRGCRVWLSPPPFDHTKLMIVDRSWTLLGSGNWDPRSLRLNFEFNLECYDPDLAGHLDALVAEKLARARQVTLADVDSRSIPVRLRDGLARLFSPYL